MTKVFGKQPLPALDNSRPVKNPDLLNIADKNYTSTIMRYSNLALLFSQLETKDKHIVGAINEVNRKIQPAKKVGETDTIGGVIIGDGLDVTAEGVLSATAQGLAPATKETLGGVIVGDYLNVTSDGTISVDSSAVGKTYYSGNLTTIDNSNKINVNMTKSTDADIEQDSMDNPNVLFFTEGDPTGGETYYSGVLTTIDEENAINVNMTKSTAANIEQVSRDDPNTLFFTEGNPYTDNSIITVQVTLLVNSWDSNNTQSVTIEGITSYSNILSSLSPEFLFDDLPTIYAIEQSANTIKFKCSSKPNKNVIMNIAYWG